MSPDSEQHELNEKTIRALAQLADGSLGPEETAELEARAAHSFILRTALERQRAGAAALRGLDLQAGPSLRERIAAETAPAPRRTRRRRLALSSALAGAVAAVALAAVLIVTSGGAGLTVTETAQLADRSATGAVAVDPSNPRLLAANVEGVPFPNWSREFGWREAGIRSDELGGRTAQTVFYEKGTRRVAYTIVSGKGISAPAGSAPARSKGVDVHSLADGGRRTVTWWRDGRTCVLSSADVGDRQLIKLATWKGDGAVPF